MEPEKNYEFEIETTDTIKWEDFGRFGGRKHYGRLSLMADATDGSMYLMPPNMEHIAYASLLSPKKDPKPEDFGRYIPVHVFVEDVGERIVDKKRCVVGLMTGESGMEQGFGVRHTMEDMNWAHEKTLEMIVGGEIPMAPGGLKVTKIASKYAIESQSKEE